MFHLVDGLAVTQVEALAEARLPVRKPLGEALLKLLFHFMAQFITPSCDGQFDVLAHALLEVLRVLAKPDLQFLLNFGAEIGFQALASTCVFRSKCGFPVVEALSDLLFQSGPDAVPQLLLALGEHSVLLVFEPLDFQGFQCFVPRFHLLGDLVLKHADAAVEALILLELEALLGHVETMFVFLLELLAEVVLNAPFFLFHAAIGFHLVALAKDGHFSLETHQMLVAETAFFTRDGFSAFFGQFGLHGLAHLTLDLLQGSLAFQLVPHRKVALLCKHTLTQFLVTKAALTTHLAAKPLFFVIACAHVAFLLSAGAVRTGELSTQSGKAATVDAVSGWPRLRHANPIPATGLPMRGILVSSYIR